MIRRASGAAAVALALIANAGALANCNFLVGVGDYSVSAAGGGDETGGQPEAGGGLPEESGSGPEEAGDTADEDDANDAAVDVRTESPADAARDAADGGGQTDARYAADVLVVSDDGGDAAKEANDASFEAAMPPLCGQGLPTGQSDFQKLVSTCVLAVSCDPEFFDVSISQCVSYDYLEATAALVCLSTIQDCAGFYGCTGRRYPTTTECPAGASSVTCDPLDNLAIDCNAGIVKNCSKYGGTCGVYVDSTGSEAVGCEVLPTCTPGDGGDQCSGTDLYSCTANGVGYGRDCTAVGATCQSVPVEGTSCYYDGPACTNAGASTCGGGALTTCTAENTELHFDCTRAAGSCTVDNTGTGYCLAPGCPVASTCGESCGADHHTITVCVGGAPYTVDCAQYPPFTSCDHQLDSSGNPFAYCD